MMGSADKVLHSVNCWVRNLSKTSVRCAPRRWVRCEHGHPKTNTKLSSLTNQGSFARVRSRALFPVSVLSHGNRKETVATVLSFTATSAHHTGQCGLAPASNVLTLSGADDCVCSCCIKSWY